MFATTIAIDRRDNLVNFDCRYWIRPEVVPVVSQGIHAIPVTIFDVHESKELVRLPVQHHDLTVKPTTAFHTES